MKSVMCFLEPTLSNYIGWKMIEKRTLQFLWDSDSGIRNQWWFNSVSPINLELVGWVVWPLFKTKYYGPSINKPNLYLS